MLRTVFDFLEKTSGNTSKNPTKTNTEKVHTRPTVLGKTYFETYEDVSSINVHCQKQIFILEADGFPFRSPTCQRVTDEKIPRVTEPLNPSTPTKPRKHTNHKHNLSSQPVFLCFPFIHPYVFLGISPPLPVFVANQSYISRRVPTTSKVQPFVSSSAQSLNGKRLAVRGQPATVAELGEYLESP